MLSRRLLPLRDALLVHNVIPTATHRLAAGGRQFH